MDGIIFILNQTGLALAQAQTEIVRLNAELARLQGDQSETPPA